MAALDDGLVQRDQLLGSFELADNLLRCALSDYHPRALGLVWQDEWADLPLDQLPGSTPPFRLKNQPERLAMSRTCFQKQIKTTTSIANLSSYTNFCCPEIPWEPCDFAVLYIACSSETWGLIP